MPEVAHRARRRIAWRLLPFLFLLFIVAYIDRTNIGMAALELPRELGFSERVIGLGAGIFFLGYFVLQIPGALAVELGSARRMIGLMMIAWGVITVFTAGIRTASHFYIVRLLLGAAEAAFFPGVVVYLTHWFISRDRAKALANFMAAVPLSFVIGTPLAGWILGFRWLNLSGWRWLFILEGIPAVVAGVVALFYLTDWPQQASWLSPQESTWITGELQRERAAKLAIRSYRIPEALRQRDVILLALLYFLVVSGNYALAYWLPTILKRASGASNFTVAMLTATPYLAGLIAMQLNGWHSDRTGERRWHTAVPLLVCAGSLALTVVVQAEISVSVALFTIAACGLYASLPVFWAMPTAVLSDSAAAASVGWINAVGNLGGFVGPFALGYLHSRMHSFAPGLALLVAGYLLAALLALRVRSPKTQKAS
ncbi:MAG TPA: MFS transporter [Terriglobales bacterium]|nr:MFS transporter [Terriglobales bacterium]